MNKIKTQSILKRGMTASPHLAVGLIVARQVGDAVHVPRSSQKTVGVMHVIPRFLPDAVRMQTHILYIYIHLYTQNIIHHQILKGSRCRPIRYQENNG